MKKCLFIFLAFNLIFFFSKQAHAQSNDPVQHLVEYKLTHVIDSTQPDNPFVQRFLLVVSNRFSYYDGYESGMELLGKPQMRTFVDEHGNAGRALVFGIRNGLFKNIAAKKMVIETMILQTEYNIEEPLPDISWTILPEQKTINDYKCQKATCNFKGRNYTAWFSSQLPFRTGPWKLGNLPGLILEAYDTRREVVFECVSFYPPFDGIKPLSAKRNGVNISMEKYKKLQTTLEKDPAALNGGIQPRNPNIVATNVSQGSVTAPPRPRKFNNPIEKE